MGEPVAVRTLARARRGRPCGHEPGPRTQHVHTRRLARPRARGRSVGRRRRDRDRPRAPSPVEMEPPLREVANLGHAPGSPTLRTLPWTSSSTVRTSPFPRYRKTHAHPEPPSPVLNGSGPWVGCSTHDAGCVVCLLSTDGPGTSVSATVWSSGKDGWLTCCLVTGRTGCRVGSARRRGRVETCASRLAATRGRR